MSYFAPHLMPGRCMIDALVSREGFYEALGGLKSGAAQHLLYVDESNSIMVAPLYGLLDVDDERLKEEDPNAGESPNIGRVEFLLDLTGQWVSTIARSSMDHPYREKILKGIHQALVGDLPEQPIWTKHFLQTLYTGDDDEVHLKSRSTLTTSLEEGGAWGLSAEPAADLIKVWKALGYGDPPRIKPGPKSS